jgi:hypothetical protein
MHAEKCFGGALICCTATPPDASAGVQYTRAHQQHQHLIVGDARALVHRADAIQQGDDLPLIEIRNGREHLPR